MLHQEIHDLLDKLGWEDVQRVASEDVAIKKHLNSCQDCRDRANKILDGELASMGADKRKLILRTADNLAAIYTNKTKPS